MRGRSAFCSPAVFPRACRKGSPKVFVAAGAGTLINCLTVLSKTNQERVLGIDPGSYHLGFSILSQEDSGITVLDAGSLDFGPEQNISARLHAIYKGVSQKIREFAPTSLAIESAFHRANVKTLITLARTQGVLILCSSEHGLPLFEYAPRKVKKAVTGNGNASKEQVSKMVQAIVGYQDRTGSSDTTDAIAVSLCHLNQRMW